MPKPLSPEPRFRFSLLSLFGFITFAAVGCAAIMSGNELWCVAIVTLVFASLWFAPLAAIYAQKVRRAFWVGFTIAGWIWFGFFIVARGGTHDDVESITTYIFPGWILDQVIGTTYGLHRDYGITTATQRIFIGQSIWTVFSGVLGGIVAHRLNLRKECLPNN